LRARLMELLRRAETTLTEHALETPTELEPSEPDAPPTDSRPT